MNLVTVAVLLQSKDLHVLLLDQRFCLSGLSPINCPFVYFLLQLLVQSCIFFSFFNDLRVEFLVLLQDGFVGDDELVVFFLFDVLDFLVFLLLVETVFLPELSEEVLVLLLFQDCIIESLLKCEYVFLVLFDFFHQLKALFLFMDKQLVVLLGFGELIFDC